MPAAQKFLASLKRLAGRANPPSRDDGVRGFHIADVPANPDTVCCNICGFVPESGHPRECPRCGTTQRQRSFRQLFADVLEREIFGGAALDNALLLSPGAVERSLLYPKFRHRVVSSLYQEYPDDNFVRADVRDLAPFADQGFDYVQASNVLDYVPEMNRAIEAIYRVCRPGAYFVFLIPERNLIRGDAPLSVSVRSSVTGSYWPDKTSVPLVRVGRATLAGMLAKAGFQSRILRLIEPLSQKKCTWWICRRT